MREEQERAGRAEAELLRIQSQQAGGYEASVLQQVGAREVGFSRFDDSELGSRTVTKSGVALTLSLPQLLLLLPLSLRV